MRLCRLYGLFLLVLLLTAMPRAFASGPLVNMYFTDAEVRDVLTALAGVERASIVADDSVTGKITIQLQNIPFDTALDLVVKTKGLTYQRVGSVIVVASPERLSKGFGNIQVIKLQYAKVEEVVGLLSMVTDKDKASDGATGSASGGTSSSSTGGSSGSSSGSASMTVQGPTVVKTEVIKRIQGSGRLRADVETNSIIFFGSNEEAALIRQIVEEIDVPYRQVMLEAQVLAITKTASKNLGVEWTWQSTPQYQTTSTGGTTASTSTSTSTNNINIGTVQYGRSPSGTPYQFLYQATINALISHNDAKLLAKPKITTLNGRVAKIHIGDQIPVPQSTTSGGATTTSVEYKDAGIILQFTPRIDADGLITASLYTGVSTPVLVSELKAYRITIREAETEVRMHDGETIVIGGLINKDESKAVSKIPFLGDLPILGSLFRNVNTAGDETEVVIFLTARIVK